MTFENLILIFKSVRFLSFQQVKFANVVIKYSYHSNIDCILCFSRVDSVIIQHTYFQTFLSQGTEYLNSVLVSAAVNTAVLTNCSFLGNNGNFSSVLNICAGTITIEWCTFENYHVQLLALLIIGACHAQQELNWSITTCSFNSNTAVYLIYIFETLKHNAGFVTISNTIFQENTLVNPKQHMDRALIFVFTNTFNDYSVHHLLNNNTIKNNVGPAIAGFRCYFQFEINNTKISSNIANHSIVSFPNPTNLYPNLCNVTLMNTYIVNNSIPQFHEHYAVVYIRGGICQIKNVTFLKKSSNSSSFSFYFCWFYGYKYVSQQHCSVRRRYIFWQWYICHTFWKLKSCLCEQYSSIWRCCVH